MAESRGTFFERYAWIFIVANAGLWAIFGISGIISPHVPTTGSGYPPAAITDLTWLARIVDFFWLTGAPLQIGVGLTAFRRHEKWAWFALLLTVPAWSLLNSYADAHWGSSVGSAVAIYFAWGGLASLGLLLSIRTTFFSTR
jgi:hypothetical protein